MAQLKGKQIADRSVLPDKFQHMAWKESARAATMTDIDLVSAPASIDGVVLAEGDRVLVKDQTAQTENGIYQFNGTGSTMTRTTDATTAAELNAATVGVVEGTVNAAVQFTQIVPDAVGGSVWQRVVKNDYAATADPTINDDQTQGWGVGSAWLRADTKELFVCFDNSTGAAIWKEISAGGGGGGVHVSTADPTVNDDATKGFDPGDLWLNTTTEKLWQCLDASTGAAVWWPVSSVQAQIIYVGKHGNDSYDGKSVERAKLTFGAAITAAGTSADEANAVTVVCLDNGTYTEDIETPSWVSIYAPNAAINAVTVSGHEIDDNCWWNIGSIHAVRYAVWKHNTESEYSFLKCGKITRDDGDNMAVRCLGGTLQVDIGLISGISGALQCLADYSHDAKLVGHVGAIEVASGTSYILGAAVTSSGNAYMDVSVGSVRIASGVAARFFGGSIFTGSGEIHANIGFNEVRGDAATGFETVNLTVNACEINAVGSELAVAEAYDIWAGCVFNLICGTISGTRVEGVGSKVRVTEAKKNDYGATTDPTVNDDETDGFSVGSSWLNTVTEHLWVCIDASVGAAVWQSVTSVQSQIIYVGKHGNDSYDGKSVERAKLTFAAAITAAGTPADEASAVTVKCFDDGEYTEDLTIPSHIHIHAPNAALKGTQGPQGVNSLQLRRMTNNGDTPVLFNLAGTVVHLDVGQIESNCAGGVVVYTAAGILILRVKDFLCTGSADAIAAADFGTGADVYVDIDRLELVNEGFSGSKARFFGRVGRIYSVAASNPAIAGTGQGIKAYLHVGDFDCANAWDLNAVSELYLLCSKIAGTRTEAAGSKVRVTVAQRNNYTATAAPTVNDDSADGYTVGSTWINTVLGDIYECVDSSAGAAVWRTMAYDLEAGEGIEFVGTAITALAGDGSVEVDADGVKAAVPYIYDKALTPAATADDTDYEATGIAIDRTPAGDSYVEVIVNGVQQRLADGDRDDGDCYFSDDAGATAKAIADIVAGDALFWNGAVATFSLTAVGVIDLNYNVVQATDSSSSLV